MKLHVEIPHGGRGRPGPSRALWAQARRRPAGGAHAARGRRGRRHLPRRPAYDVHVWSTPETRDSLTNMRELPIDTPGGGECAWTISPTSHRARHQRHRPRERLPPHRRQCRRARAGPRRRGREVERLSSDQVPAGVPRRGARRVRRAPGRPGAPAHLRRSPPDRDLPALQPPSAACGWRGSAS